MGSKTMISAKLAIATAATVFSLSAAPQAAQANECIAPSSPGGGWDFTCRTIGRILTELNLVDGNVQITNMAGGVGAVTYATVEAKRSDDPNLIVATSTVGITQIAQGRYPSGIETMRYLGMLGADVGVIAVAADSKYETLAQLNEAIVADASSVVTAGSSGAGGWDHIRLLLVARAAGLEDLSSLRWVQFDGGTDAVTQMMGGQLDVVSTDLGEIAGFVESGDIRILAALSTDPIPAFPDIPTAISQGVDVTGYNWRGLYTGGNVSDEAYDKWVERLKTLYDSEEWQTAAVDFGLVPIWIGGAEFETYVREQEKIMADISRDIGIIE
ncbi:tripartite tricarboxylate transporter substrate binding protein [Oceaniovalibus sp. ACAM 378]|uniref:Bug family tripartite tricarboxylate transporter substrate binding protein n=1 Tax=Oceaniovalibus sp. ACAM 378 TaxID=2599923 RepID=UPI0011DA781B|nr:tripartite tricarboxylate transporter substrate-binding protein [Oceaniovalibus sp. ACAM 378]TYB90502.1 tripartite tricarboxylate transporter substrate binding protein [Oceaniovalibus sp. ACAM 378]